MIPGGKNYGTLLPDEITGTLYITDVATGHRFYKYGPCRICEISNWGWSREPQSLCKACASPECNDNPEPISISLVSDEVPA